MASNSLNEYLYDEPEIGCDSSDADILKAQLMNNIDYLSNSLLSMGYPICGDLFSAELSEVKKTLACFYALLEQRQRDLSIKSSFQDRLLKVESERAMYMQKIVLLSEDKKILTAEFGKLENTLKSSNEKMRRERDKLISEKEDYRREIVKLNHKEAQMLHEIKKRDTQITKMQEQLRKCLSEKDLSYRNNLDLTTALREKGPKCMAETGDSEYTIMLTGVYEANQSALLSENQDLRNSFEILLRELHSLMEERKKDIMSKKSFNLKNLELIGVNQHIFNLPFQSVCEDVMSTFKENLRRFRMFIKETDKILVGLAASKAIESN